MTEKAGHSADYIAFEVSFYNHVGEGEVDSSFGFVNDNSLDVS